MKSAGLPGLRPWGPVHKLFMSLLLKSCYKSCCSNFDSNDLMRLILCTWHNSFAVMACAKLWPYWIIIFQFRATHIHTRFGLWAHNLIVKWVPDHSGVSHVPIGRLSSAGIFLKALHVDPDRKVHGANMGPIWGWQDPGGPHVGPMNLAIWGVLTRNKLEAEVAGAKFLGDLYLNYSYCW